MTLTLKASEFHSTGTSIAGFQLSMPDHRGDDDLGKVRKQVRGQDDKIGCDFLKSRRRIPIKIELFHSHQGRK